MDKKTDYSELRMQNVLKSNMDRIISNGVDYNLTRLEDSIKAIDKFKSNGQYEAYTREMMAGHLVVQQLNVNLVELQKLHGELSKLCNCQDYTIKVEKVKQKINKAIAHFTQSTQAELDSKTEMHSNQSSDPRVQRQLEKLDDTKETLKDTKKLQEDFQDLNHVFNQLGSIVHEQQSQVDTIENNIEKADESVKAGVRSLVKASASAVLPISGALLGTLLAGPIGCIVSGSVAIGLGTAAGGGTFGYTFAKLLKNKKKEVAENDMATLDSLDQK